MKKRTLLGMLSLVAALTITGCGTSDDSDDVETGATGSSSSITNVSSGDDALDDYSGDVLGGGGDVATVPDATTSNAAINTIINSIHTGIGVSEDYALDDAEDGTVDESTADASISITDGTISVSDTARLTLTDNKTVVINTAGVYLVNAGTYADFQISSALADKITLILKNVDMTCTFGPAILFTGKKSKKIVIPTGTTSTVKTTAAYVNDNPDATIKAKKNLVITGGGTLNVSSYQASSDKTEGAHAIKAGQALKILGGTTVNVPHSSDSGLKGDDCVIIYGASVSTDDVAGKSIYSDFEDIEDDATDSVGFVLVKNSVLDLHSNEGSDVLKGDEFVYLLGSTVDITSGAGYTQSGSTESSDQCIKSGGLEVGSTVTANDMYGTILVEGCTITCSAKDDAFNASGSLIFQGATASDGTAIHSKVTVEANEDAYHADNSIYVDDGSSIYATNCYEGVEAQKIFIDGGFVSVVSSDDGFNASDGSDSQQNNSNLYILITGGTVKVNAQGDGLDSNGTMSMTGGTVYIDGPTSSNNGALDTNGGFKMDGGTLVAVGASGMVEAPGTSSAQYSVSAGFPSSLSANTAVTITDSSDNEVIKYTSAKAYQSAVISSADLKNGSTYKITAGSYSYSFTISSKVTIVGQQQGGGNPGGGGGGNRP